jgi:hypothetical protein
MKTSLLLDIVFVMALIAAMATVVMFLYKAVRAGYRRAMIEHMRNMTESTRLRDSTESTELEDIPQAQVQEQAHEQGNPSGSRGVPMLAPNTSRYSRGYANHVPSVNGIPLSAYPNIDTRIPWSSANIEAAELPEKEGCRKSTTGMFYDCGVTPANFCE